MPITTDINNDKQLTTHKVIGDMSFEEFMTLMKQFWEGSQTMNVLWDFREWTASVSSEEIKTIVNYIKPHSVKHPKTKTALVVSRDLDSGISRMIMALGRIKELTYQIDTFQSYEDAMQWLGEN
jgi:hypothetical protein